MLSGYSINASSIIHLKLDNSNITYAKTNGSAQKNISILLRIRHYLNPLKTALAQYNNIYNHIHKWFEYGIHKKET